MMMSMRHSLAMQGKRVADQIAKKVVVGANEKPGKLATSIKYCRSTIKCWKTKTRKTF